MPLYISTEGKTTVAIAVCDRCHLKMPVADMVQDGNYPSIRGHKHCMDVYDPYRLPARQTENIALHHPRPDADISTPAVALPVPDGNVP